MAEKIVNNRLIAKNTILLYVRMIFVMAVSLYTSRVVLSALGVVDFGIYNVVGGVVSMMSFLGNSMSIAAQRFFSFEIGKGDVSKVNRIFCVCLISHFFLSLVVVLFLEIIGVWFLHAKMNIPADRLVAAHWVLQLSIITTFFSIIQIPYNAMILSKERMGIYAYISILEVVLRLVIIYFLVVCAFDKLKFYAFLQFLVTLIILFLNWLYCVHYFKEVSFSLIWDKKLFKSVTSFAGWSMFGEISWVASGQGVDILLNIFCGPIVNAANAISGQVGRAVSKFVSSFQTAMNPQIIKTYAASQFDETKKLVYRGSKISYFLLLMISLPLMLEMNIVLELWLKEYPPYTVMFTRLGLLCSLVAMISNYLAQVVRANGNVRQYQLTVSFVIFLTFPIAYFVLVAGFSPNYIFAASIVLQILMIYVRLFLVRNMITITVREFSKNVMLQIVLVSLFSSIAPLLVYHTMDPGILRLLSVIMVSVISVMFISFMIGLKKDERYAIKSMVKKYLKK